MSTREPKPARTPSQRIVDEVGSWPDVSVGPGDRGASVAFRVGRRELGHLHGDHAAHFSFPKDMWDGLRRDGRIVPHPVFPEARRAAARNIETHADLQDGVPLLRLNYDRV